MAKGGTEAPPIIQFEHVTLNYGGVDVLQDINLRVMHGETKVILGPSGVGKSTILKAILGLLPAASGKICIAGEDVTKMPERDWGRIRRRMAMVFQGGALFDSMTVSDNVSFRLRELGLANREEVERRVHEVLKFVDLENAKKLKPSQLSGGMKKRVAIARALAPHPEIFLFDEPTAGLDPLNTYNMERLIKKLKENPKVSIVVVTHDVGSAMFLADSILMLHDGKFIFEGDPKEIKTCRDARVRAFLNPEEFFASKES